MATATTTVPQVCQTPPNTVAEPDAPMASLQAPSIKPAERESLRLSTANNDLARSSNECTSPGAHSIESPLLESPSVTTPTLQHPPMPAPKIRLPEEGFDPTWTNEYVSSPISATQAKAFLHAAETPKTSVQENRSLLHLLDSKATWSENSDVTIQETEPELRPTPAGLGGWFRSLGRWFGHSRQAVGLTPEVKIELDDMPVDEFPIIPHTSGKYKPPWLSLAPLHPPGQSIVATLDVSVFDHVVDELFTPALSDASEGEGSNGQYST